MINKALDKLITRWQKSRFDALAHNIRHTAPLEYEHCDDLVIVSQVYHNAMDMSLIAIKSFMNKLKKGRVELIDDGSLTADDKKVLQAHIPGVKIVGIEEIDVHTCPTGSCWERLIHILNLSKNAYVVQVDTDTLTLGAIPEIIKCIEKNTAFTIGGPMWPEPVSTSAMSKIARGWKNDHVQTLSECYLDKVTSIPLTEYCRGCAAFAGFPKGSNNLNQLIKFSDEMSGFIGEANWTKWGTEQFSSNVMISLFAEKQILPWPKYQNFMQPYYSKNLNQYHGQVSLVHFIGSHRYRYNLYKKLIKSFL